MATNPQDNQSPYSTIRFPLVGIINTREFDASGGVILNGTSGTVGVGIVGQMIIHNQSLLVKDQRFINCIPTKLNNNLTGNSTYYLIKRPGWQTSTTPSASNPGKYLSYWGSRVAGAQVMSAFKNTNSEIFMGTTSLGSITGEAIFMGEITRGTTAAFLIQSSDNTLWYTAEGIITSFVGTTHTTTTIDGIADTSNLYVGQLLTGTGIQPNTRITVVGSGTITVSIATTSSTVGAAIVATALAKVTDVDYPGNQTPARTVRPGFVFVNGFIYVMDSNAVIYNSDLNSVTGWTANGSINSNSYPDMGVTIVRYRNVIAAFNTTSTEFFSDAGNPTGTPLINNQSATLKIGCSSPSAVTSTEDNLVWVSSSEKGGSSVYIMDNNTPRKISTTIIDQQIALVGSDSARIQAMKLQGRTLIFLILTSTTYVYCIEDQMWHEWNSVFNFWDYMIVATSGSNNIYGMSLDTTTQALGKIWLMDVETVIYTDNDSNYTMLVQTSKVDQGNSFRKRMPRLTVVGDRQVIPSVIDISWSDDDYQTFSTPRSVDMSASRAYLNNCGSVYRRRAFRLTNTAPTSMRLEGLEMDTIQGVS